MGQGITQESARGQRRRLRRVRVLFLPYHALSLTVRDRVCRTNFYDPTIAGQDPQGEITQGKNLIEVSKEVGVKFFIWRWVVNLSLINVPLLTRIQLIAGLDEIVERKVPNYTPL